MKENKIEYKTLNMEVIEFTREDVIVTSITPNNVPESYEADIMKEQ